MKKTLLKLAVVAATSVALMQTVHATLISGNIGFSGSAVLNSGSVGAATKVTIWGSSPITTVQSDSGSFSSSLIGQAVTLAAPWTFNSGPLADFWQVGGFTFNLISSSVYSNAGGFLNVNIVGTVIGNGFTATPFTGTFQVADPAADGQTTFTTRLSFASVPDGGTTMLLLGSAFSGLALIRRKLVA